MGLILGISFLEAPLKFQAPGITTELGVGIGRLVFGALNKVELVLWGLVFILILIAFPFLPKRPPWIAFLTLSVILALQTFYFLPVLDGRAERLLSGNPAPASWHHTGAGILEGLKVIVLGWCFGGVFFAEKGR